jgi:hypothetical protein
VEYRGRGKGGLGSPCPRLLQTILFRIVERDQKPSIDAAASSQLPLPDSDVCPRYCWWRVPGRIAVTYGFEIVTGTTLPAYA